MAEENVEVLRRLYASWERGDMRAFDVWDVNVEVSWIGTETPGIAGEYRGVDELSAAISRYLEALADLRIKAERIVELDDGRVLVLSRHTARGKTSGLDYELELGDLFTLRDGKIVRYVSYWDRVEALTAAGLAG
jgi:ketosteroid isomerase-like protein